MTSIPTGDHFTSVMGMTVVRASDEEVVLQWEVTPRHHQPMGIVHGGVYCAAVESACSIGASMSARSRDPNMMAVGLENQTSFVRAVRSGTLTAVATPITRGRTTQVWQADIRDEDGQLIATGRMRLLCVARDAPIGR